MFTFDDIKNISKDEFSKLSRENKELVLKILSEYKETGQSQTLKELWEVDYNEIPVSIDEFICNPYYLGKSTRNGESIYPYWRKKYREIFDQHLAYEEIILSGAIGVGKTRTAVVCLAYLLYRLMCLKNPQEYFSFNEGDKITIFFLNINLALAEGVGYTTLHEYLLASDWFLERGTVTGRVNLRYNPPHNITITFGSKSDHALGQQIYCSFMDEVDFTRGSIKGNDALDVANGIMQSYTTIKERINSRFIKNGVQYGRLFLVSSKKSEHDFIEAYIRKMKAEGQDKHMLIVDEPQWVIKAHAFSGKTFPVAVGNRSLQSRILKDDLSEEERDAIIKQGYRVIDVPIELKQSFVLDVNQALMNLAGISILGATSFFNYAMFSKCYVSDYKNPFTTDILTIGMNDDLQIQDFFEIDKIPYSVRRMPQFIHIDASLTGDKTGISDVGASGVKETKIYNGSDESIVSEMTYKHIFSVDIKAPAGTEISFEKTRRFIYYLKANGFNIVGVSLDGFQSADTKQTLITQGYDATIISLDKSPQGYLTLLSAMNDQRIGLIQIELLEKELIQLQRDVKTGKLDHPADGCFTKDTRIVLVDGRTLTIEELLLEQEYKTNYVYTFNITKGVIEPKPIKKVFQTKLVTDLLEIELDNGQVIQCTPEHRFMCRDGSYVMAKDLCVNQPLMPLYTKMCEKGLVGYRMYYEPFEEVWHFEHRRFCTNIRSNKGVVHHRNYIKSDNRPCNLIKISNRLHRRIHNNTTLDYNHVSKSVRSWHKNMRGTPIYEQRSEKCRQATYRYLRSKDPNYTPHGELLQKHIEEIEDMFGVVWEDLTLSEKNSYGVKYSRIKNPEIQKTISDKISEYHKQGKYKKAQEAISNRVWYTNGVDSIYIKKDATVPDGFVPGRTINPEVFTKRKKLSDMDEETQKRIRFNKGNAARGKKWINNGEIETYVFPQEPLPDGFTYGRLKKEYKNHKVVSIKYIHKPCRVYDLEIQDNHNFALAAGVFVHNSKDLSDSLAGALYNATLHKQSLIDSLQLLSTAVDINDEVDPQSEFMSNMQQSLLNNNSKIASETLDSLLDSYGGKDILSW